MSELSVEEKEAIKNLRFYSTNVGFSKYDGTACLLRARDVQILLNLLGKQHQELEQEKEKNKEIETDNLDLKEKNRLIVENLNKSYISKDKIKELLENEIIDISGFRCIAVEDIEYLLEGK